MTELSWYAITREWAWQIAGAIVERDYYDDLCTIGYSHRVFQDNGNSEISIDGQNSVFEVSKRVFGRRAFNHARMWSIGFMCDLLPPAFYAPKEEGQDIPDIYDFDRVHEPREWKMARRGDLEELFEKVDDNKLLNDPNVIHRLGRVNQLFMAIATGLRVPEYGELRFE